MKSMPDGRLMPTPGDSLFVSASLTLTVKACNRKFACTRATDDERRYGCYWVVASDGEEYVVTADVSGLRSRTFRPCSNS